MSGFVWMAEKEILQLQGEIVRERDCSGQFAGAV